MKDQNSTDNRIVRERMETALQHMDAGNPHAAMLDIQSALAYMAGILARREYAKGYDDAKKIHGINGGL